MFKVAGIADIAKERGITAASAKVFCTRQVKAGKLIRLKKNFYFKKEDYKYLAREDFFRIAAFLQTPSYISLLTALSYYEITTQIVQSAVESIAIKRTKRVEIQATTFLFLKIQPTLYSDFIRKDGYFIAKPEKALLDSIYLASFGKYSLDFGSLDMKKLNMTFCKKLLQKYPEKTRKFFTNHLS